jgi:hypothetical protein
MSDIGHGSHVYGADYLCGDRPISVFAADLYGDGSIDLAAANAWSDYVSIMLSKGNGSFSKLLTYTVGELPVSVFAADFDGDGDLDAAGPHCVSYYRTDGAVSVSSNNGDGLYNHCWGFAELQCPIAVVGADFDGDADVDLASANYSEDVTILFNQVLPHHVLGVSHQNRHTRPAMPLTRSLQPTLIAMPIWIWQSPTEARTTYRFF